MRKDTLKVGQCGDYVIPAMTTTNSLKPWCLYCPQLNLWAGLTERGEIVPCESASDPLVQVFDERDNKTVKAKFYTLSTGIQWQAVCAS